jgi:hypothetical protein
LGFPFSPGSFNFNFDESVTYMPGPFCYRHARSHNKAKTQYPTELLWSKFHPPRP